jgi:hypothetical protein
MKAWAVAFLAVRGVAVCLATNQCQMISDAPHYRPGQTNRPRLEAVALACPQSGAQGAHRGRGRLLKSINLDFTNEKTDPDTDSDPDPEFFAIRSGISQQRLAGTAEPVRVVRP